MPSSRESPDPGNLPDPGILCLLHCMWILYPLSNLGSPINPCYELKVSVNSGSWWWTGRPGVLRFMGKQRVGHDWATDLIWYDELKRQFFQFFFLTSTSYTYYFLKIDNSEQYPINAFSQGSFYKVLMQRLSPSKHNTKLSLNFYSSYKLLSDRCPNMSG